MPLAAVTYPWVRGLLALAALALMAAASESGAVAPLYDPVSLNIGINCQWQQSCQRKQMKAMDKARKYIAATNPPLWRIHLCNRNARRATARIDWVGFNGCIRNAQLSPPPPPPPVRHRARHPH